MGINLFKLTIINMQWLKWIKEQFAEELYSWTWPEDYEDPQEYHNMINDYINELTKANPEWEKENLMWEAWYICWYERALRDILNSISTDEYETKTDIIYDIKYYLNN